MKKIEIAKKKKLKRNCKAFRFSSKREKRRVAIFLLSYWVNSLYAKSNF